MKVLIAEKLDGFKNKLRLRVGDYRILFEIEKDAIKMFEMKHVAIGYLYEMQKFSTLIMFGDISVILCGIGSLVILALIYYFYRTLPIDTERGRNFKKYIFNFKVKPENSLQVILPVVIMSIITSWITNKTPSTNLPNPILFLVVVVIVQPLSEEVMFRGILLGGILAYTEKFKTSNLDLIVKYSTISFGIIFISGYLFAALHYTLGTTSIVFGTFLTQPGGLVRLINGILYGLFFWLSGRNISSSYAAHATTNLIIFLFEYLRQANI